MLSQLGRHASALEHAQTALILLQEELLAPPGSDSAGAPPQADRIAVLAIAYHNIGVEQEFLKRYEQSMLSYRKGVEVAERYLGSKHAICVTLRNSLIAAKKTAAKEEMKASTKSAASGRRAGAGAGAKGGGMRAVGASSAARGAGAASSADQLEADRLASSMSSELTLQGRDPSSGKK